MNYFPMTRRNYRALFAEPQGSVGRGRDSGLTLVEMMVAVALLAVVVAVAVPNLSDFFINNRLSAATNELVAALNSARSEAMRRGAVVAVRRCASVDATTGCSRASSAADDWGSGWYLFVDVNRNRSFEPNGGDEVLRGGHALSAPLTLHQNTLTFGSAAENGSVAFCPDGRLGEGAFPVDCSQRGTTAWSTVFVLCYDGRLAHANRSRSRAVLVSRDGRVRVAAQDVNGLPLNDTETAIDSCTSPRYQW